MALCYVEQANQETMNDNAVVKWDAAIEKRAGKAAEKETVKVAPGVVTRFFGRIGKYSPLNPKNHWEVFEMTWL
jgi:hypothetical protein